MATKRQIGIGKAFTTIVILIFVVVGMILTIGGSPVEHMTAFTMLIGAIFPYLIPVLGGVAIKGIAEGIMDKAGILLEKKKGKVEDPGQDPKIGG
jgi:hypothetical protein